VPVGRRVLFVSHDPNLGTGLGRVSAQLLAAAAGAGHVVDAVGIGGRSLAAVARRPSPGVRVTPVGTDPGEAAAATAALIAAARPELLVTFGDPWLAEWAPPVLDEVSPNRRPRWLAYFPIDAAPFPPEWRAWAAAANATAVTSDFSRRAVRDGTGGAVDPAVLYHGVDLRAFAPPPGGDKRPARARVGLPVDAFVVGTVAANQPRKNLPALVDAFARFAADKPDAWLYLHCPAVGTWDLAELVASAGVEPRTRVTLMSDPAVGLPDGALADVYRSFDAFALSTTGEGFGLPLIEAQACGVPAVATDCSACPELLADRSLAARVRAVEPAGRGVGRALVDEADLAAKLDHLYRNPHDAPARADVARRFAERFGWPRINDQFLAILRAALDDAPADATATY